MTEDQQSLVNELLQGDVGNLDDWTITFLESLYNNRWRSDQHLTEKQLAKLHDIAQQEGLIE